MNTIMRCHEFAKATERTLIIDTTKGWMKDDIRNYIDIQSTTVYKGPLESLYTSLSSRSVYPEGITLETLDPVITPNPSGVGDQFYQGPISLTYELNDKDADVMVYSMYRLGDLKVKEFLQMCRFTPQVLDAYRNARSQLPAKYVGIHVRNTDYKSNVNEFMEIHKKQFADKALFVASDNKDTITVFQKRYGSNVYSFTNLPDNGGKPLHDKSITVRTKEESIKYNLDTFVDILLLVTADKYYASSKQSGFSQAILEMRGGYVTAFLRQIGIPIYKNMYD
jgi:hypothetical protein